MREKGEYPREETDGIYILKVGLLSIVLGSVGAKVGTDVGNTLRFQAETAAVERKEEEYREFLKKCVARKQRFDIREYVPCVPPGEYLEDRPLPGEPRKGAIKKSRL